MPRIIYISTIWAIRVIRLVRVIRVGLLGLPDVDALSRDPLGLSFNILLNTYVYIYTEPITGERFTRAVVIKVYMYIGTRATRVVII